MKISLIIAVYKDITALGLILETLTYQTYKNFEVIVAEDAHSIEMKNFIQEANLKYTFDVKHTYQEDKGVRKARSQNNALLAASGVYVIFIDGDCLLYSTFIEGHIILSKKKRVLSGRRVNIPIEYVLNIKKKELKVLDIEKNYLFCYYSWILKKSVRYQQGIYIKPCSILYKLLHLRKPSASILGCNFSCWRDDLIAINGFDESYGETAISDDIDLEWRFKAYGLEIVSCKNAANMFHLDHAIHDRGDATKLLAVMKARKEKQLYKCEIGLNTHV